MRRFLMVLALAISLMGCELLGYTGSGSRPGEQDGRSDEGIAFTTDAPEYALGETITLRLENATTQVLGYNLCSVQLQRSQGGAWTSAEVEPRVCTTELRALEPGATTTYEIAFGDVLPGDRYRFETTVERMESGTRPVIYTNTFVILD